MASEICSLILVSSGRSPFLDPPLVAAVEIVTGRGSEGIVYSVMREAG